MSIIEDGTGQGASAGVTEDNQLETTSITTLNLTNIGLEGGGWNISTGTITLTSANKSALAYIENTGNDGLILRELIITCDQSNESGGTNNQKQTYLFEIETPIATENLPNTIVPRSVRQSKEKSLSVVIKGGVEGSAVTSGITLSGRFIQGGTTEMVADGEALFFLEPTDTLALTITPPAGNTSMKFSLSASIFKDDGTL